MGVNWDEFYFLSQVYEQARGELRIALNTFHVHLFQWLRLIPGGEVNQVVAGRLAMLALEGGTVFFIVQVARRFLSFEAALAAGVVYLAFGNVIVHGASFRTDPIATVLLMGALLLVVCSKLRKPQAVAAAVLVALAGLITMKSVFYVPALAVAALWRIRTAPEPRRMLADLAIGAVAGAAALAGLFLWHMAGLAPELAVSSADQAGTAYRKTLQTGTLFPRWDGLERSLLTNPLPWLAVVVGLATAGLAALRDRDGRWGWLVLMGLALPLASLAVYRNAFPYFYAFILPPACVLAGLAFQRWLTKPLTIAAVVIGLMLGGVLQYGLYVRHHQHVQRAVVDAVHRMFPQPVPYIERSAMIGSFPHAGFFMTTWGMENYRQTGRPALKEQALARPPVFMIVGHPALEAAVSDAKVPERYRLLPEDAAFLRENFVPHWGPIWVAGKRADGAFEVAIPGPYTVEAVEPVELDGVTRTPGEVVALAAGRHTAGGPVTLRWGERLYRPKAAPPEGQLHWGF